jgi:hypothetical protein
MAKTTPYSRREAALLAVRKLVWVFALVLLGFGCAEDDSDDCKDSQCTNPPEAFCTMEGEAVQYDAEGTCQADVCAYPATVIPCEDGDVCVEGECVAE